MKASSSSPCFAQGLAQLTGGGNELSKLGLLKNLNLLSGKLRLRIRLTDDYVKDFVDDAQEAELKKKIHLQKLAIQFDDERKKERMSPELWLGIIDALEPQPNLKRLTIVAYYGPKLPSWILSIHECTSISALPPLEKLPCLEEMDFRNMYALRFVGREWLGLPRASGGEGEMDPIQSASTTTVAFPKLKKLQFRKCSNWTEWEDITAEEEESADLVFMPCLTRLILESCKKLTVLPHRLLRKVPSLEVLFSLIRRSCSSVTGIRIVPSEHPFSRIHNFRSNGFNQPG